MKVTRNELVGMIKESIKRYMLNEGINVYAVDFYSPYDSGLVPEEEIENFPVEIQQFFNDSNEYRIEFCANAYYEHPCSAYGYAESDSGICDIHNINVCDDDGFSDDLQVIANIDSDLARKVSEDFKNWCNNHSEQNLDFKV